MNVSETYIKGSLPKKSGGTTSSRASATYSRKWRTIQSRAAIFH